MSRSRKMIDEHRRLKAMVEWLKQDAHAMLAPVVRDGLIDYLAEEYLTTVGTLDSRVILKKGWKGFEDMTDFELVDIWMASFDGTYADNELPNLEFAEEIEIAIIEKIQKITDSILFPHGHGKKDH